VRPVSIGDSALRRGKVSRAFACTDVRRCQSLVLDRGERPQMKMDTNTIRAVAADLAQKTRGMENPVAWRVIRAELKSRGIRGKLVPPAEQMAWELRRQLRLADKARHAG